METYGRRSASQVKVGGTPNWTKSSGFINLRQRQDDIYNSGMPGENPFQSMYQATISAQGNRAQTAFGGRNRSQAVRNKPQQMKNSNTVYNKQTRSAQKMDTQVAREQIRKFGEFEGGDEAALTGSIWQSSPCKYMNNPLEFLLKFRY